jgi:hypothetical protein
MHNAVKKISNVITSAYYNNTASSQWVTASNRFNLSFAEKPVKLFYSPYGKTYPA